MPLSEEEQQGKVPISEEEKQAIRAQAAVHKAFIQTNQHHDQAIKQTLLNFLTAGVGNNSTNEAKLLEENKSTHQLPEGPPPELRYRNAALETLRNGLLSLIERVVPVDACMTEAIMDYLFVHSRRDDEEQEYWLQAGMDWFTAAFYLNLPWSTITVRQVLAMAIFEITQDAFNLEMKRGDPTSLYKPGVVRMDISFPVYINKLWDYYLQGYQTLNQEECEFLDSQLRNLEDRWAMRSFLEQRMQFRPCATFILSIIQTKGVPILASLASECRMKWYSGYVVQPLPLKVPDHLLNPSWGPPWLWRYDMSAIPCLAFFYSAYNENSGNAATQGHHKEGFFKTIMFGLVGLGLHEVADLLQGGDCATNPSKILDVVLQHL